MSEDQIPENESQYAANVEQGPQSPETARESGVETEANAMAGAEILENPPAGGFVSALRAFVNWVNDLLAKD